MARNNYLNPEPYNPNITQTPCRDGNDTCEIAKNPQPLVIEPGHHFHYDRNTLERADHPEHESEYNSRY